MSLTYKIEFQFNGRDWTDVTDDVHQAQWRFGQLQPNQVGTLLRPADGSISLHNQDGRYTAYNPATGIDPTPGVPVRVSVGGLLMFSGWSEGFHTLAPLTENYMTEVPIVGPLYRYSTYNRGIFRRVVGSPTTGNLLALALNEVSFPIGNTDISANRTRLFDFRANAATLLGKIDRPASLLDVCKTLAQAELGRIYDDYRGYIVFEGRQVRGQQRTEPNLKITLDSDIAIQNMAMTRISDAIINSAVSSQNAYRSTGRQNVELQYEGKDLPSTEITVTSYFTTSITFTFKVTEDIAFVQSWEPLQQNVHYEYKEADGSDVDNADDQVFLYPLGDGVTVSFVNPTANDRTAKVLKLEGDVFQQTSAIQVHARSEASISKYGLKEVEIPLELVFQGDRQEIKDHLNWVVNTHDGITNSRASVDPMRQINLTYKINDDGDQFIRPKISNIVELTAPRLGINQLDPTQFWVDAIDYKIDNQGSLVIKLGLTDARYTSMWPFDGMSFAKNTKPGF